MTNEIKKGATVEAEVHGVAFGGRGIARMAGMVMFIEGALPGDTVRAVVTKRKPQFAEANMVEVVKASPYRRPYPCPVFGVCGGCKWQHYDYSQQLIAKQQHVEDAFRPLAKRFPIEMRPILPSPDEWFYRNKMEFSFGTREETGQIILGFHRAGDWRRILPAAEVCQIQPPGMNEVMSWFTARINEEAAREGGHFVSYNQVRHQGFLRHLVVRHSRTTGQFLLAALTASGKWGGVERFAAELRERFPACAGFIWGTTDALNDVARMEKLMYQSGDCVIEEQLGERRFRISTFSFFQTNTPGAKVLYDAVKEFAELTGRESVLDAYCGTGTLGIYLADQAARVVGIEIVKDAVWDARYNAKLNQAENCTFLVGEMRDVLPTVPQTLGGRFDRVIVDPPRGGMDKKSLRLLIDQRAPLLVYVSCNPATLGRDAQVLAESGYVPEVVQPVDMFPQTYHVESVIRFRLNPDAGAR